MGTPAPKPENFDQLAATWDDPAAFAIEQAKYYRQLSARRSAEARDITEPIHGREESDRG
jgi:hypothetical protein